MRNIQNIRWAVEFSCVEGSLSEIQNALPFHGDPWFLSLDYSEKTYPTIGSSNFETKTTGQDVFYTAKVLFNQINGSFFADGARLQIRAVSVFRLREGQEPLQHQFIMGSLFQNRSIFGSGSITLPTPTTSGDRTHIVSSGSPKHELPQPTFSQKAVTVAAEYELLSDALRETSSNPDWHALSRAFECLRDSKFADGIKSKKFTGTLNCYGIRHAKHKHYTKEFDTKHGKMTINEGRTFIRGWMKVAIDNAYRKLTEDHDAS